MDPQAPSQAPQQPMPQPPEAPPDAFGGALQAIALGFAAGFGGKTVSDQIAQQRQNSWEAWQRNQEAKLRREEMDRRDRQFAMSLDMQRTEMEYRKSRDMKDDEARDKAKMEADIGTDAARISAEADLGPLDPNLPMSEVNRKLEDKRVGSLEMRAITREDMKANAQATEKAADRQLTIDLEGKRGDREAAALKQRDEESKRQFAVQRAEIALKGMQVGAADRANVVQIGYALAEKAATIYGRPWSEFVDSSMARARQDLEAGGSDALKALMANLDSEASTLGNDAASGFGKPTDAPTAPDSRPAVNPDTPRTEAPPPPPPPPLTFGARAKSAQRTASEDARKAKASKRDDAIKKVLEGNPNLASEIEAEIAKGMNGGVVTDEILIEKVKSKINSEGGSFGSFDRPSVDLAEEIKRALQKMRAENRRR